MNTNRSILLITILLILSVGLKAQSLRQSKIFGEVKLAASFSDMDIKGNNLNKQLKIGYILGADVNYKLTPNIYLQSGFYLKQKGYQKETNKSLDPGSMIKEEKSKESTTISYMSIPLGIGFETRLGRDWSVFFSAGGYFAYGFKGKYKTEGYRIEKDDAGNEKYVNLDSGTNDPFSLSRFNRVDYGLYGTVGVVYDFMSFSFSYDHGLNNVASGDNPRSLNRNYYIGAGVRF